MEYRRLGISGLKVSEISLGSWLTFGKQLDLRTSQKMMAKAHEMGINFFDNAEVYANGLSESIMGEALKNFKREHLIISTKIFWGGKYINQTGLSRKHLIEGTKNSLKRLQLEYVDLLYCHRPDPDTPLDETILAMDFLIRQGFALYWGTSEWPAEKIDEAYRLCEKYNCIKPTMEQPQYNMFWRDRLEKEYSAVINTYGLGTTIWSPLASGILTGKYNNGIPEGSRLALVDWLQKELTPQRIQIVKKLNSLAADLNITPAQLAIAWCLKNPHVSSVIIGASSMEQLEENIGSSDAKDKLTDDVMKSIEQILSQ